MTTGIVVVLIIPHIISNIIRCKLDSSNLLLPDLFILRVASLKRFSSVSVKEENMKQSVKL